ncbi:MAG: RNB domain-containing ribonuclease, partial [Clostridia bacterium]|nr:RNB domain-containing ribonuclease [Clostridia bacterium]
TYNQVQDVLDGVTTCDKQLRDMLQACKELAKILIDKRQKRGNINFVSKEVSFVMKDGKVVDVVPRTTLFSHQIIEEFMIVANETVAQYASDCGVPFVYRVHDKPDSEKVAVLIALLKGLGITIKETQDLHATSLSKALNQAQDTPYFNLINDVMLRTMQKAKYSDVNTGHFGLASACYCHFTSPIRRYADLVVHRVLKTLISGKMTQKALDAYEEMCQASGLQASKTEKIADEAERKADDVKKCQYAATLLDKPLEGIVSGVTENGIFVQLANTVEGFVSARLLSSGATQFIKEKFTLVCPNRRYSLGDKVRVAIYSVNQSACKIDMMLVDG